MSRFSRFSRFKYFRSFSAFGRRLIKNIRLRVTNDNYIRVTADGYVREITTTSTTIPKVVDIIAPIISSTTQTFVTTEGEVLSLEEVTATDDKDGVVAVVQSGTVDFNTVGSYDVVYTATDSKGNSTSITHTYIVNEALNLLNARDTETLTNNNGVVTVQANGTETFGASYRMDDLIVGQEYTLTYNVGIGNATAIYGRIDKEVATPNAIYDIFINQSTSQSGEFTFEATLTTMYAGFISTTDNAYFTVDNDISFAIVATISTAPSNLSSTLLSGKLHTQEDLDRWRYNKDNSVYVSRADTHLGSNNAYERIVTWSNTLANNADYLTDYKVTIDTYPFVGFSGSNFSVIMNASIRDYIEDVTTHQAKVVTMIKEQCIIDTDGVLTPSFDFTDRTNFPVTASYNIWLFAEWQQQVLWAYDFLPESAFTTEEHSVIEQWFTESADWLYEILEFYIAYVYDVRADLPENSTFNTSYSQYATGYQRYKGSRNFYIQGLFIENKRLSMIAQIVKVGVKFPSATNANNYKQFGMRTVREYLAFNIDEDGYNGELNRSTVADNKVGHGLAYIGNSLAAIAEISHILKADGYADLFSYSSFTAWDYDTGATIQGTVEKSIEWMMEKYVDLHWTSTATPIYPLDATDEEETTDNELSYVNITNGSKTNLSGRAYYSASIINQHYKNPKIRNLYFNNGALGYGNMADISDADNSDLYAGTHACLSDARFMYADVSDTSY